MEHQTNHQLPPLNIMTFCFVLFSPCGWTLFSVTSFSEHAQRRKIDKYHQGLLYSSRQRSVHVYRRAFHVSINTNIQCVIIMDCCFPQSCSENVCTLDWSPSLSARIMILIMYRYWFCRVSDFIG